MNSPHLTPHVMKTRKLLAALLTTALLFSASPLSLAAEAWIGDQGTLIAGRDNGLHSGYEPSGAFFNTESQKLIIVGDDGDVSTMNADGTDVTTWSPGGDLEGITMIDPSSTLVYLADESTAEIIEFDLSTGTETGNVWELLPFFSGYSTSLGIEALTYGSGYFWTGVQATGNIDRFQLHSDGSVTHLDTYASPYTDVSGLHYDSENQLAYAIYDGANIMITLDSAENTTEYELPGSAQEGIALGDNTIFIAEDSGDVMSYALPVEPEPEPDPEPAFPDYQYGQLQITNAFTTITFDEPFTNQPVVFAEIQSENYEDDVQLDIRYLDTESFQIRLEEDRGRDRSWLNRSHSYEDITWMAFDPTEITPGYGVEAGTVNFKQQSDGRWTNVGLTETYTDTPIVFTQIQSKNGWHVVRDDIQNVTTDGFELRMEEDKGNGTSGDWDGWHIAEDIAYIAFDSSLDLSDCGMSFGITDVDENWTEVCFNDDCSDYYESTPVVTAEIQSENEADTVQVDLQNITESSFEIRLEELDLAGWDGVHVAEDVAWVAYGTPLEVAEPEPDPEPDPEPEPEPEPVAYNILIADSLEDPSSSGTDDIADILETAGHTVTFKESAEIESEGSISSEFDIVLYPGGTDPVYDAMDATLQGIVQNYVSAGGNFIGICGGSIAGSENMSLINYYGYTMSMLGVGAGVTANYDTAWTSYVGNSITADFEVETDHAIFGNYSAGDEISMTYAGGPAFSVDSSVTVLATYTIDLAYSSYSTNGAPAIVETSYGDGEVILFAAHPEFTSSTHFLLTNAVEYLME